MYYYITNLHINYFIYTKSNILNRKYIFAKNFIFMTKIVQISLLMCAFGGSAQSLVQSVNSGSIIASNTMVSIGEIVVVPQNQNLPSSGIIGILSEISKQTLEVAQFDLSDKITVYPNPTVAQLFFDSKETLKNEKVQVYNNAGQLVFEKAISGDNSIDLTTLSSGIYLIQLSNKTSKTFKIIKH